jgi:hypothetical protein
MKSFITQKKRDFLVQKRVFGAETPRGPFFYLSIKH